MGTKLRPQRLLGDKVNRTAEKVLEEELDAEIALGCGGAVEIHKYINIAPAAGRITDDRSEKSKPGDPVSGLKLRLAADEDIKSPFSVHHLIFIATGLVHPGFCCGNHRRMRTRRPPLSR